MLRKLDIICDTLDFQASGDPDGVATFKERLFSRFKPPGMRVCTPNVPKDGPLKMQVELSLTNTQVRGLRSYLSSWGFPSLPCQEHEDKIASSIAYDLHTSTLLLETGRKENEKGEKVVKEDPVCVIRVPSVRAWLDT